MNADACSLEADGPGLGTTTGDHTDILCFGTEQKYRCSAFESERSTGTSLAHQTDSVDTTWPACLDGTWVGYRTFNFLDPDARLQPSEGMVAFRLTFDPCAGTISGTGNSHYGSSKISGTCKEWDVGFINEYHDPARGTFKLNWNGKYDSSKDIISGEWSYIDVDQPPVAAGGTFYLRRTVPSNLQFLGPNPVLTNARQRWRYACDAVLHQARQRLWSWSVFKRVFDTRKRLVDLNFRRMLRRMRRLAPELISEEELCEVEGMQRTTVPAEGEFCISIAETRTRMLVFHDKYVCPLPFSSIADESDLVHTAMPAASTSSDRASCVSAAASPNNANPSTYATPASSPAKISHAPRSCTAHRTTSYARRGSCMRRISWV